MCIRHNLLTDDIHYLSSGCPSFDTILHSINSFVPPGVHSHWAQDFHTVISTPCVMTVSAVMLWSANSALFVLRSLGMSTLCREVRNTRWLRWSPARTFRPNSRFAENKNHKFYQVYVKVYKYSDKWSLFHLTIQRTNYGSISKHYGVASFREILTVRPSAHVPYSLIPFISFFDEDLLCAQKEFCVSRGFK